MRIQRSLLAVLLISLLALTACARGPIQNKRAPGLPGEKRYEILVNGRWIEITSAEWDACQMQETYPACRDTEGRG